MPDERKKDRFAMRPDAGGFTVYEIWTGKPAVVGQAPQTRLSEEDAKHILDVLNKQARMGDSSMRKNS